MSVNSKMTAIADEIRVLSGTTGTMGLDDMATNIGNANTEVSSQADLLAQIQIALEGKAAGGSDGDSGGYKVAIGTTTEYNFVNLGFMPIFVAVLGNVSLTYSNGVMGYEILACSGTFDGQEYNQNLTVLNNTIKVNTPSNLFDIYDNGFEYMPSGSCLSSYLYIAIG